MMEHREAPPKLAPCKLCGRGMKPLTARRFQEFCSYNCWEVNERLIDAEQGLASVRLYMTLEARINISTRLRNDSALFEEEAKWHDAEEGK